MSEPSNIREQIQFYERTAKKFDRSVWSLGNRDNRNHHAKIGAIVDALRLAPNRATSLLEVGTGTGLHAAWLLKRLPLRYTGVDVSEDMLRIAAKRLGGRPKTPSLMIADAHKLPYEDGAFDAAFCTGTLHHLRDPGRGVSELVRVVRSGGRVAMMEPNWKYPSVLLYSAITPAERNTFKISPARLEAWSRAAGLVDVELRRVLYTPPLPRSWTRFWDAMDRGIGRLPVLRRLSIVLLVSGTVR